jgi:hypothetical protein
VRVSSDQAIVEQALASKGLIARLELGVIDHGTVDEKDERFGLPGLVHKEGYLQQDVIWDRVRHYRRANYLYRCRGRN